MQGRILSLTLVVILLAAAMFLMACGGDDADEQPTAGPTGAAFPSEVQLTDADNGRDVQLALTGTLIVALPSNPTTGFSWSVSEESGPQLRLQGEPEFVPAGSTSPVVGAGGTEVFTFEAVGLGTAELTLEYRRPFEPGSQPAETFTVTFEIR